MARKGRNFELSYKWLYDLDKDKYKVTSPAFICDKTTGDTREVDVLIEYYDKDNNLRKIAVECRDRNSNQDLMWIEQLKTKRDDLGLDFIVATTTSKFTKGAISKAKYHGVIIEEAELFDANLIKSISNEFFFDLFFIRFEVEFINFLTADGKILSLKEIITNLDLASQMEFINFLNYDFYSLIEPNSIIESGPFTKDDFFANTKDNFISSKYDLYFKNDSPNIIKKINLDRMYAIIKLIPLKFSLPLNKSLSIFDVNPKSNKKYSAYFGDEEEYLKIGYLDDQKVINEIKLKERPYCRFVGANLYINTIFPCDISNHEINMDEIMQKGIGKFDFSKVLK